MKAMQFDRPQPAEEGPLHLREVATPKIGDNEILVEILTCGVCHTDLHEIEGDIVVSHLPRTPGHEIVGKVVQKGPNVSRHAIGDRVGVAWLYSTCGTCQFCAHSQENLCNSAQFTGFSVDGGYAEYIAVHESFAYQIPRSYSNVEAAPLMCAGVIGYRSLMCSGIQPGQKLGLYGFGASAHIVLQIAKAWDCEVYVVTRSENHQKHALELGAKWAGGPQDDTPGKLDAAITFAPSGSVVLNALKALDRGGTVAINAIHLSDIPPITWDDLYYERKLRSVAHTTRQDARDFLRAASEVPIHIAATPYKISQANQALLDVKTSKINGAAVLDLTLGWD